MFAITRIFRKVRLQLITLIKDFLSCRKQRVVLKGQHSWADVKAGVPQESVIDHLLFSIYINNLQVNQKS